MGETPDEIRHDIEETRDRMTETVEAIGYRADVKTRAKEAIVEKKDSMVQKAQSVVSGVAGAMPDVGGRTSSAASSVGGAASSVAGTVADAVPDRAQIRRAASVAQSNPIGLALGATAVGFVAGLLIPSTRIEDEKLGQLGDQVREQARDVGQEALQHGKEIAQETGRAAADTLQQQGQEHGQELASSLQESARGVASEG